MFDLSTLDLVDCEVSSYCNRKCWHCPNSVIDRMAGPREMGWRVFGDVARDLAVAGFHGIFSFIRYNEPLAYPLLGLRISRARQELMHATLQISTNGD
ncbi:unnamed protein product, partial [marine sediment metagenome]